MKRVFTFFAAVLLTVSVFAQTPEKMSYQAVIRNSNDQLVTNQQVGMQISILQGSANGAAIYTETQTPTTNVNGLLSIEIGGGTSWDVIDWASGVYFLKTETDPTGGTNYTITGTSQLLSVPYALYAKTAETVTGGIAETDPVYTNSQAVNITATDITNLSNLSGVNSGDQDISGIATNTTAIANNIQAIQDTAAQIRGDIPNVSGFITSETDPTVTKYSVGDFAQGGIVFWVDETGQYGLVCAKEDQNGGSGIRWYAGTYGVTRATGDGVFAGELNTAIILSSQVVIGDDGSDYAAQICNDLQVTEGGTKYGDWYLPSKEELELMYQNKATIDATAGANGGSSFASAYYWSSTEDDSGYAWGQGFFNGGQDYYNKGYAGRVRAVRAF